MCFPWDIPPEIIYLGVFGHGPLEQRTATNNVLEGWVGEPPSTLVVGGGFDEQVLRIRKTCKVIFLKSECEVHQAWREGCSPSTK